ncbi:MAG TPA: hypothetical protein VHO25_00360, partial [Polyangiaceae bacterium]|nr:hypothetical protein [Polyangiaceae bacterium]
AGGPNGCDVEETCGSSTTACPADVFKADGASCGDGATDCSDQDTCDASHVCQPNNKAGSFVCRSATPGGCDVAETCGGSTTDCPTDAFVSAGTDCGSGPEDCSNQDTCDGSGACQANHKAGSTECRAAVPGGCDIAETCGGSTTACPTDAFVSAGTSCGSGPEDCSNQDTCDGSGTCQLNHKAGTTVCRAAAGGPNGCDVEETCGSSTTACPTDLFKADGATCGNGAEDCSDQDTCDASHVCQPNHKAGSFVCRAAGPVCDVEETCGSSTTACPTDVFAPNTQNCGDAGTECTNQDKCSGTAASCTDNGFVASGTSCGTGPEDCSDQDTCNGSGSCQTNHKAGSFVCRAAGPVCDVAETCGGSTTACPTDVFAPNTQNCGDAGTQCTNQDKCSGTAASCTDNGFVASGTSCGTGPEDCSDQDTCNGSGSCLVNHKASSFVCRAAGPVCDVAETCGGSTTACPTDVFAPNTQNCGDAGTQCTNQDKCSGTAASCTDNGFVASGTSCGTGPEDCSDQDTCNGSGTCQSNHKAGSFVCRAAGPVCDVAETCGGSTTACPT